MNKPSRPSLIAILALLATLTVTPSSRAVEALLLQDTYVDNGTDGGKPPPNASNYGSGMDLRVFKGNGRLGRALLKFSLETLPPGTTAQHVAQARLRLWINGNTTAVGGITLKPITSEWDEYKLTGITADNLSVGSPHLQDLVIETVNNFVSIDVTQWAKAWLDGKLVNQGILVEPAKDTDFLDLSFDSKESIQTSHEARLEITSLNQR